MYNYSPDNVNCKHRIDNKATDRCSKPFQGWAGNNKREIVGHKQFEYRNAPSTLSRSIQAQLRSNHDCLRLFTDFTYLRLILVH